MRFRSKLLSLKRLDLILIILMGLIPILWLRQGYLIARGDYFPFWLNPSRTLGSDIFLWTSDTMGHADPVSSFLVFEYLWLFPTSAGLTAISIQILIQILLFMGAGLSMYFLARALYPDLTLAPVISSVFYMANIFILPNRLNDGFVWTYMFLPLLMAILVKTLKTISKKETKERSRNLIYFAIVSTIALSFASINPANVVIFILVLTFTLACYCFSQDIKLGSILPAIFKLCVILLLVNIWWIIPIMNYYLWSSTALNPAVNVIQWSWTHVRASFLNLFWLNGGWSWRPEYFPYIETYSNPFLLLSMFVPFLLASTALLFKSKSSKFNAGLWLSILVFIFLAKGLHDPLGQVNLFLYSIIPGMAMFREPQSKFTMALLPFLSLLLGYSVDKIAALNFGRLKTIRIKKPVIAVSFILVFILSAYPMIVNPIELKTSQLPFSSYVQIPDYWYRATDWLNEQPNDDRILVTPPNDFYAMPYTWGYYGTDDFIARFIQKPVLSTYYSSYKINNYTAAALDYLGKTIAYNRTTHFEALLDLLNIRYILQRNDIQYDFPGKKILSPTEVREFLTQISSIHLSQRFGQLDIYEYANAEPYIYTLDQAIIERSSVRIETIQELSLHWDYLKPLDFEEWQNNTFRDQFGAIQDLGVENTALKAELWNSTWGWKAIISPILPATWEDSYEISMDIKGQDAHQVHIKTIEYDFNKILVAATYNAFVNDGTFNWTHIAFNFEPTNRTTKYLQVQIWHGHETDKPFPNTIWIDNVEVEGHRTTLNTTGLDLIFNDSAADEPATILDYSRSNPAKITAKVDATEPFILAVSEALDESWTAYVNGKQYKSISLYLGLKGFSIDQTGLLEITIEYEPQRWFFAGSIVSVSTFVACVTYLTYNYTKNKNTLKRIKTALKRNKPKKEPEIDKATQTSETKAEN